MTTALPTGWEADVLSGIGAPVTPTTVANLDLWQQTEGGSTANPDAYNPFNTTLPEPGSVGTNSVNVQAFPSWPSGLAATESTLLQPNMAGIVGALQADAPTAQFEAAVNASPWGTHFSGAPTAVTTGLLGNALDPTGIGSSVASGFTSAALTAGLQALLPGLARLLLYVAFVAGGIVLVILGLQRLTGARSLPVPIPVPLP